MARLASDPTLSGRPDGRTTPHRRPVALPVELVQRTPRPVFLTAHPDGPLEHYTVWPARRFGGEVRQSLQLSLDGAAPIELNLRTDMTPILAGAKHVRVYGLGPVNFLEMTGLPDTPAFVALLRGIRNAGGTIWLQIDGPWVSIQPSDPGFAAQLAAMHVVMGRLGPALAALLAPSTALDEGAIIACLRRAWFDVTGTDAERDSVRSLLRRIPHVDPFDTPAPVTALELAAFTTRAFLDIGEAFSRTVWQQYERARSLRRELIRAASGVVAASEVIAQYARQDNRRVVVIEYGLVPEAIPPSRRPDDGKLRIACAGNIGHFTDLPLVIPALRATASLPNVEWHFWGTWPDLLTAPAPGYHQAVSGAGGWWAHNPVPSLDYHAAIGASAIGLAPLQATGENRARSPTRFVDFACHGIPLVLSDLEPYRFVEHGKTGFLAKGADDFTKYVRMLLEDADLRGRVGAAAKAYFLEHFTLEAQAPRWESVLGGGG